MLQTGVTNIMLIQLKHFLIDREMRNLSASNECCHSPIWDMRHRCDLLGTICAYGSRHRFEILVKDQKLVRPKGIACYTLEQNQNSVKNWSQSFLNLRAKSLPLW